MRNQGLKSALSAKVLEGAIHVVDVTSMNTHKTAALVFWIKDTTPTDMPSNLSLDDPHVLEEASPLDVHGAKRGQPETTPASMSSPTLELPIQNFHDNQISGNTQLNHKIFAHPIRRDLVHRVVKWQLAKRRQGTHKQKNISEVSGSGRKPWKQKGTGKARAGHSERNNTARSRRCRRLSTRSRRCRRLSNMYRRIAKIK